MTNPQKRHLYPLIDHIIKLRLSTKGENTPVELGFKDTINERGFPNFTTLKNELNFLHKDDKKIEIINYKKFNKINEDNYINKKIKIICNREKLFEYKNYLEKGDALLAQNVIQENPYFKFDPETLTFNYKNTHKLKDAKMTSNIMLLLYGYEAKDKFNKSLGKLENYSIGQEIDYLKLYKIINNENGALEFTENKEKTIRKNMNDLIDKANNKIKEKIGIEILKLSRRTVKVIKNDESPSP